MRIPSGGMPGALLGMGWVLGWGTIGLLALSRQWGARSKNFFRNTLDSKNKMRIEFEF
jgi:hypothetical protein